MPIYWVEHEGEQRLGIVPRPRGGDYLEDEMVALRREGVDVLLSLLTRQEQTELGLELEASACRNVGVTYLNFPIADRSVPESRVEFLSFWSRCTLRSTPESVSVLIAEPVSVDRLC